MFALQRPFASMTRGLGLEPEEGRRLWLMGALVAVLLCAYTIAKVLRDALFLAQFGALALPYAYLGVALASAGFVWLETAIAHRFTRAGATHFTQYFAIACSVVAALVYPHQPRWTTALFYAWTGSQAMMLLPHFWLLALDGWDSRRARRVFPLLAGCGLLGGLAGGGFAGWTNPLVQRVGLMWTLPPLLLLAHALTRAVEARRARLRPAEETPSTVSPWKIIGRSRYLQVFVVVLALSVIVGTLVDFQFKLFLHQAYPDQQGLTRFLGRFYFVLNALSLVFQFGLAGWLLQRIGLGVSSALQPVSVLAFSAWLAVTPGMWVMVGLRWIQGVLSQTLGKSTNEIYYTAIRPNDRRRVKPAIDTLVERWSDAAVGALLILVLHALRAPIVAIAIITAVLAIVWIGVMVALDRQYGRTFQQILSSRWIEPEEAVDALRVPAARRALLAALSARDEDRIVLALRLSGQVHDARIARAVRECLTDPWPAVRCAAVVAMNSMRLPDRDHVISGFLADPDEHVRQAAVAYLLIRGPEPVVFARGLLDSDDAALRGYVVDALFDSAGKARAALTPEWIDARIASGEVVDAVLAARALGVVGGPATALRLRGLLGHPDHEVRRAALVSAARCPAPALLDVLLPLLFEPGIHREARAAVAAIGNPAVPDLERLLGKESDPRTQSVAARTLAQIGGERAIRALMTLVRGSDVRRRYFGLRGLARARRDAGHPILPRHQVHRLFLRELREVRTSLDAAVALESHPSVEVRLLAESCRETAEMALERAVQALACWYEPRPLTGVFARLKSRDRAVTSPALDYLEHVLPRATFGPARQMFEGASPVAGARPERESLSGWIETLWRSEDGWLRACAVRASRHASDLDPDLFVGSDADPVVRAELDARRSEGARWFIPSVVAMEASC